MAKDNETKKDKPMLPPGPPVRITIKEGQGLNGTLLVHLAVADVPFVVIGRNEEGFSPDLSPDLV
jgi:hypothetical protein